MKEKAMDIYHPDGIPGSPQEIPEEFRKMCMRLCQDEIKPRFTCAEDVVNYMTSDLDSRERQVVKAYFDSLFALNLSDRELLSVWRIAGSDLLMSLGKEGQIRDAFVLMASLIKTQ